MYRLKFTPLFHTYFQNGIKTKYMGKSLLLYQDQKEVFDTLSNEQAGLLIKAIFQYQENGEVVKLDPLLNIVMIPIRQTIDRNSEKYDNTCKRNAENVGKRWDKKNTKNTSGISGISEIPSDTKNTNNNSNSNNNNNSKKEENEKPPLFETQPFELPISEQPIVQALVSIYKLAYPNSYNDIGSDFPAAKKLSTKICTDLKIPQLDVNSFGDMEGVKKRWNELLDHAKTRPFFSSMSIDSLQMKYADLVQSFNAKDLLKNQDGKSKPYIKPIGQNKTVFDRP